MAIDAEDILVCVWRLLRIFIDSSYVCAQKHPFLSCMLLLLFFFYVFFNLLVYHSPFLICIAILLRFFWTSEHPTGATREVKEEDERERENQRKPVKIPRASLDRDVIAVSKNSESPSLRRQKSRRTRVKPKEKSNIEWSNVSQLASIDEEELLFPLSIDKKSWSFEHGETSDRHNSVDEISKLGHEHILLPTDGAEIQLRKSDGNGVVLEADIAENRAEDEEEEEEEEAYEGVNDRALEWTEDDQKNLVDLGLSEIERNRRLESLITKRRARKLIKSQLEKGLIDLESVPPPCSTTTSCQIPPIFVARSNPFEVPNVANEIEGLQVPGSAPSILLPTQNPFDLPYDPLEEKPNLMADSFTQEFTAVNQKEMMFCRHESFSLGPFHIDAEQDQRDPKFSTFFPSEKKALMEGLRYSPRFRKQSGDHDSLIDQLLCGGESHIDHTPSIVQSRAQRALQESNSEISKIEGDTETKNDMISEEETLNDMESANQMDSISTITEVDTEPSLIEDSETTSSSSFEVANNRAEVSIGLEPIHGYVEQDNMFSYSLPTIMEPLYDSSPTANDKSRMDDDRLFFGDKHAIHTPSYSIASDLQVEVSEVSSTPLTVGNISQTDGESLSYDEEDFDGASQDDMSQVMEEVEKLRGFSSSHALAPENTETTMQLAEKLAAHPFFEVLSETTEKSFSPSDESTERNTVCDVRDSVSDTIDDIEDQQKYVERYGEEQVVSRQEIVEKMAEPAVETDLECTIHSEGNSQNLAEYLSVKFAQPINGDADLNLKGDSETQTEQESVADASVSVEAADNSIMIEERKDEQNLIESEISSTNQTYEEVFPPAEQQESIVEEEIIVNSSSSTSSMATTIEKFPVDEVSSSNLDQVVHITDAPKSDMQDGVKGSSQEEQQPDDTSLIMPRNVIFQEQSAPEKFTDEANIISKEVETLSNPSVAEELSETLGETGSGSNENIQNVLEKIAEKSSSPADESGDRNAVLEVRDSESDTIDDIEDQENEYGEEREQILTRQEVVEHMIEPTEETGLESAQPIKGDADLNLKGDSEIQTEQESVSDASKSIEAEDNLITLNRRKDEQSLVESEAHCINQKYEEVIASAEQQESIAEEVLVNASASSSPTAATTKQIPVDEVSSSNPDQMVQITDVPKYNVEKQSPDGSSLIRTTQNEEHLVEHSSTHLSNISDSETFQKPSASDKFTDEAKILSNTSEPVTEDKSGIEKSESNKDTNEEAATIFNPEVAEELSETPAETGAESNEDIKNVLGKLAEEATNPPGKNSEDK